MLEPALSKIFERVKHLVGVYPCSRVGIRQANQWLVFADQWDPKSSPMLTT